MINAKCPNCNATLDYDLNKKELKCNFCGQTCSVDELNSQVTESFYECTCPSCGAKLVTNSNIISTKCAYCRSSLIFNEKTVDLLRPEKILLFEIDKVVAIEKVKNFFNNLAKDFQNLAFDSLQPIYLPYWVYDCICEASGSYPVEKGGLHRYLGDTHIAKIKCKNFLVDASQQLEDNIADLVDINFDLSKLVDFDNSLITGYFAEKFDVESYWVYDRFASKLKSNLLMKVFRFLSDVVIIPSNIEAKYILLPFYYTEIDGIKILVNGQDGSVAINSEDYLSKSKKQTKLKDYLYGNKIGSDLSKIQGMIIVLNTILMLVGLRYKNALVICLSMLIFIVPIVVDIILGMKRRKVANNSEKLYVESVIYDKAKHFDRLSDMSCMELIFLIMALIIIIPFLALLIYVDIRWIIECIRHNIVL